MAGSSQRLLLGDMVHIVKSDLKMCIHLSRILFLYSFTIKHALTIYVRYGIYGYDNIFESTTVLGDHRTMTV